MTVIDKLPDAEGVVYPDRNNPIVTGIEGCQETSDMVAGRYVRCGKSSTCVVEFSEREIYWMCREHGWHSVRNRGGKLLTGEV